ncbi:MAG: UbiA prenyltransferase family protein [Dehalococcoidales bacterium]|jgi:4-hydroxybenzoate polyprenyltransferase
MNLSKVVHANFGSDLLIRDRYSAREKLAGHLTLARPLFLLLTPLNAASAAVLSIRGLPSWGLCLAGFFTGALAAAGVNIFNRWADRERDKTLWPSRGIPSGRVKAGAALGIALASYAAALALCWIYFNPTAFFILLGAEVLGSLYSTHLRDKIGYLSLPPIEGLIFLCGWACLAPETVFTTALPWYLYLLGAVWQSGHIMAHYLLNIRYDKQGKAVIATPAFFSKPSPRAAARMTLGLAGLLFIMSVLLPLLTSISWLYIVPAAAFGLYTLYRCRALASAAPDTKQVHRAWSTLALYRMVISAAIILSIIVYH